MMKNLKVYIGSALNKFLSLFNFKITEISNQNNLLLFLDKIFIYHTGHDLIRIGEKGDGGYLIPNILNKIEYCISLGVEYTTTFEDHLSKYNIKSILVDGSVDYTGKHQFIKKYINTYNDKNNLTIEKMFSEIKEITNNKNLILQMDIENFEIEAILSTSLETLKKFKILVIEFHHFKYLNHPAILQIYERLFTKILKEFTICHIHPNTACGVTNINKIKIPDLLEITFLNNEEVKLKEKIDYNLPHKFDTKNYEDDDEIILSDIFYKK